MCVVALAWQVHPRWQLVLAGNRDEFHARPTEGLARWEAPSGLLGGRDLQAGGMWMGVSEHGRLAVVTNLRSGFPPDPEKLSRGALVKDWLAHGDLPQTDALDRYNPFNLFVATPQAARLVATAGAPPVQPLQPGVHGLSNAEPGAPWPRKERLEASLSAWIEADGAGADALLDALACEQPLRDLEAEPASPVFIRDAVYGTRASSIVLIDRSGRGLFVERRFKAGGQPDGETRLEFSWPMQTNG